MHIAGVPACRSSTREDQTMRNFRAILARENIFTEEGWLSRVFPAGCFDWRALPLTLTVHHDDPNLLGRIDSIERVGDLIIGHGVLDDEGEGPTAVQRRDWIHQIEEKVINGISVEAGAVETLEECVKEDADGFCEQIRMTFVRYQIGAASVVTVPALEGTLIELDPAETPAAQPDAMVASVDVPDTIPDEWLLEPADLPDITAPDGRIPHIDGARVFGYLCSWNDCHISFPNYCQTPWRSASSYAYAQVCGPFPTAAGQQVRLAALAVQGGHYPTRGEYGRQWREAQAHYDDPTACAAYVAVGENEHGVWYSGMLRAGVTDEQLSLLTRHQLSGDWRTPTPGGAKELVGMCSVNIPGFVRDLAFVASGDSNEMDVVAAVIGGGSPRPHSDCGCGGHEGACSCETPVVASAAGADLEARVAMLEASNAVLVDALGADVRKRLKDRLR